jgi:hypothetical protein
MRTWHNRSIEEAHLLNPAFCCTVLTSTIIGYQTVQPDGIPFALTFIVLPLVLHKTTREALPRTTRTSMITWLDDNAELRIGFADRVINLKPYTQEAILFGDFHNWLNLDNGVCISSSKTYSNIDQILRKLSDEPKECVRRARVVGKWLGKTGSATFTLNLWGIIP